VLNTQNTARLQDSAHFERANFCKTLAKKACTNCTASQVVRVADGKVSAC